MLQETANGELVTSIAINVELGGAKDVTPTRWLDFFTFAEGYDHSHRVDSS